MIDFDKLEKTIKSIKLTSGEELVGFVHDIGDSHLEVQSPFLVSKASGTSFMLLPWMVTAKVNQVYAINILNVSSVAESTQDFLDAYIRVVKKTSDNDEEIWEETEIYEEEIDEEDDFYSFNPPPDESIH